MRPYQVQLSHQLMRSVAHLTHQMAIEIESARPSRYGFACLLSHTLTATSVYCIGRRWLDGKDLSDHQQQQQGATSTGSAIEDTYRLNPSHNGNSAILV